MAGTFSCLATVLLLFILFNHTSVLAAEYGTDSAAAEVRQYKIIIDDDDSRMTDDTIVSVEDIAKIAAEKLINAFDADLSGLTFNMSYSIKPKRDDEVTDVYGDGRITATVTYPPAGSKLWHGIVTDENDDLRYWFIMYADSGEVHTIHSYPDTEYSVAMANGKTSFKEAAEELVNHAAHGTWLDAIFIDHGLKVANEKRFYAGEAKIMDRVGYGHSEAGPTAVVRAEYEDGNGVTMFFTLQDKALVKVYYFIDFLTFDSYEES